MASSSTTPSSPPNATIAHMLDSPPPHPKSETSMVVASVQTEGSSPLKNGGAVSAVSPPLPVETMAARLNRRLSLQESPPVERRNQPMRSQVYRPPHRAAVLPPSPARRSDGSRQAPSPFHDWNRGRHRVTPRGENDLEFFMVGKLLSGRPPNPNSLKGFFHSTWKLQGTLSIQEKPNGRFVFAFGQETDQRRIMRSGPWKFDNALMVFAEYDGIQPVSEVALDKLGFWVDIVGVAPACHRKGNLKLIGDAIGQYVDYDWKLFQDGFVRIRVLVNLHFPVLLKGPVVMENGITQHLKFWYENMLGRCSKCGVLTHFGLPCTGIELPEFKAPEPTPMVKTEVAEPPPLLRALLLQTAPLTTQVKLIEDKAKDKTVAKEEARKMADGNQSVEGKVTKRNLEAEFDLDAPVKPMILIPPKDEQVQERQKRKFKGKAVALPPDTKEKRERSDPMDIDEMVPLKKYKPSLAMIEANVLNDDIPPEATVVHKALEASVAQVARRKKGRPFGSKNKVKKERLAPVKEIQKEKIMIRSPTKSPVVKTSNERNFPDTKPDPASPPKENGGAASA